VSSVFLIPEGVPPQRATLASNLETAVNAVWDSDISVGDSVLVAGFGIIGALISMLVSRIPGVSLAVLETNGYRCRLARDMGFRVLNKSTMRNDVFDCALNTTADGKALQYCMDHTGYESQVTEVSFYAAKEISIILGENFHTGRKRIVVSQVSHIPGKKLNRWDYRRRKGLVFSLLKDARFDELIRNTIAFAEAPGVFDQIRNGAINEISIVLQYR
jgi:threonine dehydrogenase-like Zn-dependent dehydrogenase